MQASEIFSGPLAPVADGGLVRPRIGIAGMSIESSTFSPHLSGWEAFTLRRGDELVDYYGFLGAEDERGAAADWVGLLHARSLPGGAVPADVFADIRAEILAGIAEHGPFDAFYLDIHGAMSVVGMDDAEGDLATAIRAALGPDTLVSASMDLHGNVSPALRDAADLLTCYRMAPHEDVTNTKLRAVHNLLTRLRASTGADPEARRPWKAWVPVPVLLPGEKTSTRLDPALSLYARVPEVEARDGVVDAAIWVGYAWADEPRCHAVVMVTGDDRELIAAEASALGRAFWDARADFVFVAEALDLDAALANALAHVAAGKPRPYLVSDSGDNPTAGGAGDVSWTLGELLAHPALSGPDPVTAIHASIFDPEAVALAEAAGVGARVTVHVGGHVDPGPRGPVELTGEVFSVTHGDPVAGTQVVIRSGGVHAIITQRRKPFHHVADLTDLGLDPHRTDIVVVKIGYLEPELFELAEGWTLALTPGGVDQDLLRLGHHRLAPGTFPFEITDTTPDLRAHLSRGPHEE